MCLLHLGPAEGGFGRQYVSGKGCTLPELLPDDVETVEGLADDGSLHPVQEAFHEEHALQCGFCTGGFVMATKELLDHDPDPDREAIRAGLADNICRCTGYQNIVDAVERAADYRAEAASGGDGDGANGDGNGNRGRSTESEGG